MVTLTFDLDYEKMRVDGITLRTWILTTAGGSEDCKQEMIRHYNKEGMKYIEFSK